MEPVGRGGAWVWGQFALIGVVIGAGFVPPDWPAQAHEALTVAGAVLAVAGGAIAVWASRLLGRGFTPYPKPLPGGSLVETGPFRVVRHPVYSGGIVFFTGYALYAGVLALAATFALAVLWALKARVEEGHLRVRYPGYDVYRERVPYRLLPFVY